MAQKKRRSKYLYVSYRYPDGVDERIGRMLPSGDVWVIRFHRVGPTGGKETEEETEFTDSGDAAVLLFERWWDEQRKIDADSTLLARKRIKELSAPETRRFLSHALFDAMVDGQTRMSHRALEGGIAPWNWWETVGRDFMPPCGFGCRCTLIAVNNTRAQRMIESGEAFDLTTGLPAEVVPDPRWKQWSDTFLRVWEDTRQSGASNSEAKKRALVAAKSSVSFDARSEQSALSWTS